MFLAAAGVVLMSLSFLVHSMHHGPNIRKRSSDIQIIKSPGTYKEAEDTCGHLSDGPWHLPSPHQSKSELHWLEHLIRHMERNNSAGIWLALIKKKLPSWTNIDESVYAGRVQENGDTRKTCGLVKLRYEAAVSDICESSGYGYICQIKNCTMCPPDISPHNCIIMGENCYILGCDAGSWFEASNRCVAMGTTLATLHSEDEVVKLVRMIKRRPNNPCKHFWVGILKAKWIFQYIQERRTPDQYFWYTRHPVPGNNCAVLREFSVGFYWASTDCQARHEFNCVRETEERRMLNVTETSLAQEHINEESSSRNDNGRYQYSSESEHGGFLQRNLNLLPAMVVLLLVLLVMTGIGILIQLKKIK